MIKGSTSRQDVFLPPVSTHIFSYSATEPQYTTTRQPNQGQLYLSSQNTPPGTDRSNCRLGGGGILAQGMGRLKVLGFATLWCAPNCNPRNNVLSFYSSVTGGVGGTKFTVTLPIRNYDVNVPADVTQLVTDILAAMNTVTGTSGLTFSAPAIAGFPRTFTLTAAGGTFVLDPNCLAVAKGQQMFGFPVEPLANSSLSTTKVLGTMFMVYTQYIDICSTALTKWDKMPSSSTGSTAPIVLRAYAGGAWGLQFQDTSSHPVELSWKADEPLTTIDITMYDQGGDPLYVPRGGTDFIWQLTLAAEL